MKLATVTDRLIQVFAILCATAVLALGIVILRGWLSQDEFVVVAIPDSPLMVANTAICAGLIALGIMAHILGYTPAWVARVLGGAAALIAFLTSVEWSLGINLGIDQLFAKAFTSEGQEVAGRMSPHTASSMLMLGVAVVYLSFLGHRTWPLVVPATLATVSLAIAVAVFIGYLAGYRIPLATTMSPQTTIAVVLLGTAIFATVHLQARWKKTPTSWWMGGPLLAFLIVCPVLVRFGFLVRESSSEGVNFADVAQIITLGMTAFAVAATIASHLALSQYQERRKVQQLKDKLESSHEVLDQKVKERTQSLERHRVHLRNLTHQLTLAEERERRRISRELHDYLAQMLVAARMRLSTAKNKAFGTQAAPSVEKADDILADCLNYSRTLIAELSPTILFEQGIVPALRQLALGDHGRELEVKVLAESESFPLTEEEAVLVFQSARELVHNVAKHTEVDDARVEIGLSPTKDSVVVRVVDKGAGFDLDSLKTGSADGLEGYGLFSIRERLHVLDGSLEIDAAPGAGTSVTLRLPLERAVTSPEPVCPTDARKIVASNEAAGSHHRVRIVLVDDHQVVREGLRMLLEHSCGMEVVAEAEDGEEALDIVRQSSPDVVLMDINMPRMNGIDATRELRRAGSTAKILALTMQDDEVTRQAVKTAGGNGLLSKSSVATTICDEINEVLAR